MGTNPKPKVPQTSEHPFTIQDHNAAMLAQIERLGGIGHWEVDLITGENTWSDQFYHILGIEPGAVIPTRELVFSVIHPEDRELAKSHYQKSLEDGSPYKIEKRIVRPTGEIRYVISEGLVERNKEEKPVRLFGIFKDITDIKLKEIELEKTNIQLENILNTTQDLIFLAAEDGTFLKVAKSCEKILGYLPHELIGKSFRNMIHPDDFDATLENRNRILAGYPSSDFKNRYYRKDGSLITLSWSSSFDKTTNTVFGIARDITPLLKTQEKLRQDRQKLAIVLDSSHETIWALDREYSLLTANHHFLRTMKEIGNWDLQPGDSLIYNSPLPEPFIKEWKGYYDRAFAGENFSIVRKVTMMEKSGFIEVHFKPIYEDGNLIALGCYSKDITLRKEEEIRISELTKRLTLAQKIGKLGYWEFDIETQDIYWSDEVYAIWEMTPTLFNPNFDQFFNTFHPDDREEFFHHHSLALEGLVPLDAVHRIVLPSGEIKYVHEKGELETDPETGTTYFRGTVQDITVEKSFEKELVERNQFIEAALHHLPTGLAVNKIDSGEATYINPSFLEIYGWPTEVIKDVKTFFEKIYPDPAFHDFITTKIKEDIQSGDPERMSWKNIPIVTETGEKRIISAKNIPLPKLNLMISTVVDETDAYWADHSLKVSNERFHLATQAVSDAIWDWDVRKNSIFLGKGYQRLFGFPVEMQEIPPGLAKERIHPEDYPSIFKSIQETRNDKTKNKWSGEYRFRKYDETYTFVQENLIIIRDPKGNPIRIVGSLRDISQEKEKELELQKKTRLIASISYIIQSFLETEDWQEFMDPTLKLMGESTDSDRVYFFKNFKDPVTGKEFAQQTHEWTNGTVSSELDNPAYQAIDLEQYPISVETALKGKPFIIQTHEAEENMRLILEQQGIKSILLMPIFVDEYFYGFMGFDDCTKSKSWSDDEIGFLASVTTNLSLAIERKQNLDKIRDAFASRDSLVESIGDSFYAFDKNYIVTYWNTAVGKLTGIKAEKIIGKNIWESTGIVNEQFKQTYEIAFSENKSQNFETFDIWVNAWLEVTVYPSNGGLSVIIKDITERKRTENQLDISNERFAILSEASNDAIWDWNIETGEHFWGEGYQKLFGIDTKLEGNSPEFWEKRVHPDDIQAVRQNLDRLLDKKEENYFEIEYRFKKQDNSYAFVIDKGSVIRNKEGKTIRMVGAMQDITPRKSYEESLKSLNLELAQAISKLKTTNQELEQFAYVASHDLQEPLRMISSFLGLIERKYAEVLDEKGHQYIHYAVDGARRMKEIILDLLEFSRLGNTTGPKKLSNSFDLLQEVLVLNGKLINEKNALIHIGPMPEISCHTSQIIQVFQNLISNGLKYQPTDNIPEIWIEGQDLGDEWKFSVRDNGIGIDPEYQEKIFIIFQRLHLKEQFSGSGIGLALCKKIVEFHGGKIWVESSPGEGSNFYFTLSK